MAKHSNLWSEEFPRCTRAGDKAYHSRDRRQWLRKRGIGVCLAHSGGESSQRLGRPRYKVERSSAWLGSYRRLSVYWERKASTFLTMLGIARILICYKYLKKHADGFLDELLD